MAYIGVSPSNGVRQKHTYTATASQTTFSGAGSEGISLSYRDSNYVDVYVNGVKLGDADYTATSGTSIVLGVGAAVNDIVEIITYDVFSVADTVSKADGGTFDGNVAMAGTLDVTGDLTVDTSTLHVDSANNRVGVGTVSPAFKSQVDSPVALSGSGNDYYFAVGNTSSNSRRSVALGVDGVFGNAVIAGYNNFNPGLGDLIIDGLEIQFRTNGTEKAIIDGNGNLGIGTTSPRNASGFAGLTLDDASGGFVDINDSGTRVFTISGNATGNDINTVTAIPMRFKTNNTERMRIDSSGNVLVGTTDTDPANDNGSGGGIALLSGGVARLGAVGGPVLDVNRIGSDGEVARFRKDGSTVGSITSNGGAIIIGSSDVGVYFDSGSDRILPVNVSTNSVRNDAIDIGGNPHRFKDLYLSGGVNFGAASGSVTSQYLDDYEEGSWTPDFLNDGATTYDHQVGRYVKIGQLVMAWFHIDVSSNSIGTNALRVGNLPFTGLNVNNEQSYGAVSTLHCNNWSTTNKPDNGLVPSSSTYADLYKSQGTTGTSQLNGNDIGGGNLIGCIIYRTA